MSKTTKQANPSQRVRTFAIELYAEWENLSEILQTIKDDSNKYAIIKHDCDVWTSEDEAENPAHVAGSPKKVHYHVWTNRVNGCTLTALSKRLGIETRFIQKCENDKGFLRYLFHLDDPDKFQYPRERVVSNFDLSYIFRTERNEVEIVIELLETALSGASKYDMLRYAQRNNCYDVLRRNWAIIFDSRDDEYQQRSIGKHVKRVEQRANGICGKLYDENGNEVFICKDGKTYGEVDL